MSNYLTIDLETTNVGVLDCILAAVQLRRKQVSGTGITMEPTIPYNLEPVCPTVSVMPEHTIGTTLQVEGLAPSATVTEGAQAEPKKRGRKPKAQGESETAAEEVSAPVAEVPVEDPSEALPTEAPTIEKLREALGAHMQKHGMPKTTELLNGFGKQRVSDIAALPVDKQIEFLRLCNA